MARGVLLPGPVIEPTRYGLLSVVQGPYEFPSPEAEGGVEWEDALCGDVFTTLPGCGLDSTPPVKSLTGGPTFEDADPFTIYATYDCSTGGRRTQDAFDIARARLLANEGKGVERVFWTGVTNAGTILPSLAGGNANGDIPVVDLTPAGGALCPIDAVAALESNLADCSPGLGVIHANYGLATYLFAENLVINDNGQLRSGTGQRFAFGAGYPGTGPAGNTPAAGETWMFATGPVIAWRGDVFMTPDEVGAAVDRSINQITVFAERTWAVGFSCCLFAVRVALGCASGADYVS